MKKEEKKQPYILCPRCELNYIKPKEKYCTVCKAEMGLVDPSILLPDEEEAGLEKLCPVCHVNYIGEDEKICFICQKEMEERKANEEKDEWAELERENASPEDIDTPIGILPLDDEPILSLDDEPEEEEEEPVVHEADDFDYPDTLEGFDEEDDEDDEEEDEDDGFIFGDR